MKPTTTAAAVVLFALSALAPAGAFAQEQRAAGVCPAVIVSCPDLSAEKRIKFTANVSGGDPSVTPTFKWSVSGGRLAGGQGTREIVVEIEGEDRQAVTVDVGGYPSSCQTTAACSIIRCGLFGLTRKVAEYGDVKPYEEKTLLGSFAQELRSDPTAEGYVMAYAGRRARRGEAPGRGRRAVRYLVDGWGMDARRLVVIDGGHREAPAVELYLVSAGGMPPQSTPTVEPSEVEFVKEVRATRARGRRAKGRGRR